MVTRKTKLLMELPKKIKEINAKEIGDLFRKNKPYCNVEEYHNFQYYSDDVYPEKLIDEQRPNEQKESKDYRKLMYQPVFSEVFNKVFQSISKISRADGFFISYPSQEEFTKIKDTERLPEYLHKLPKWLFDVCLKQYLIDANGVCLVWSLPDEDETKFYEPYQYIINSDMILHYEEDVLLVYKSKDEPKCVYSVDGNFLTKWKLTNKGEWVKEQEVPNGAKKLTAFKLGGVLRGQDMTYQSRIKAMLPWLNVATVEFSDLRAEITMHIHSQQWIYENEPCGTCNGSGSVIRKGETVKCTNAKCNGGYVARSPFEVIKVRGAKTNFGETAAPTPPMGYIQKQTEIAELQDKRIKDQTYSALSAVNMQFLYETPATQSGVAKSYDRDETNNTLYSIAQDLARIIKEVAEYTALWRYGMIYPDEYEREKMLPTVVIPNTFDIVSGEFLVAEIKAAKDSGLNDAVLSELEIELIKKRFPNNLPMQDKMITAFELDPASGKTDEEKGYLIANRMMSKADGIISTYIFDFVSRAAIENKDFYKLPKADKMKIMYNYADEKNAEISLRDQVIKTV